MKIRAGWKAWSFVGALSMVMSLGGCQSIVPEAKFGGMISSNVLTEITGELNIGGEAVEDLTVEETLIQMFVDDTAQVAVKLEKSDSAVYRLQYTSSDESICTVAPDGTVQGKAPGKTTITVEELFTGLNAQIVVLVEEHVLPDHITLSVEELTIGVKDTASVKATVSPTDAENKQLTWKSSDEAIATVSTNGEITGVAKGTCVITAIAQADSAVTAELKVEVTEDKQEKSGSGNNNAGNTGANSGNSNSGSSGGNAGNSNSGSSGGNAGNSNSGSSGGNAGNSNSGNANSNSGNGNSASNSNNTESNSSESGTTEAPASAYYVDSYAEQVLSIVNARRAEAGLAPLSMNYTLVSAAKVRASEITQSFSHTRPNGTSCFTAFNEAGVGYSGAGENIAAGQWSPDSVMNSWMNSEGHRANILKPEFTQIGIACYYDPNSSYGYYWVQCFIY